MRRRRVIVHYMLGMIGHAACGKKKKRFGDPINGTTDRDLVTCVSCIRVAKIKHRSVSYANHT